MLWKGNQFVIGMVAQAAAGSTSGTWNSSVWFEFVHVRPNEVKNVPNKAKDAQRSA
jgi:hypothetical protein